MTQAVEPLGTPEVEAQLRLSARKQRWLRQAWRGLLCVPWLAGHLVAATPEAWFDFEVREAADPGGSAIDLRGLNEAFAGEHGFIVAKEGQFARSGDGVAVRFWAVNGPPEGLAGDDLRRCARLLARYGVNLVRVHGPMFDERGEPDSSQVRRAQAIVEAFKAQGIYTHFSIYFPLWFRPRADLAWLEGYDGSKHPFAALLFNPQFAEHHRAWFKALLTTPDARGRRLVDDAAVMGVELQNEDSFFFWTFSEQNVPEPQLRLLEKRFGDWLVKKYGSLPAAIERWQGPTLKRDTPAEGRMAFRPLWNMTHEKTQRDSDSVAFLYEVQEGFYKDAYRFLRGLGFRGLIQASNWTTASPEVLGPIEKWSYMTGDFVDRHGYFECGLKGENAAWSMRPGHTYRDRSALRFEALEEGKPKVFVNPVMDPQYGGKPSIISETTFTRPNRFRSEAPLYYAAYGALQDSDAIVHFAFDGAQWQVKPRFWMQPWTLGSPAMMGQFPAAASIYRRGLVKTGDIVARVNLNTEDLLRLKGTPLPQDASLDELRLRDLPAGGAIPAGERFDPLLHYVGRAQVEFSDRAANAECSDLSRWIDHGQRVVRSTTGELKLDYGLGLLVMDAPMAQGACGALRAAGKLALGDVEVQSEMELGAVVAVALDDNPLVKSKRILLQVMSEERSSGFLTEAAESGRKRIVNIGKDPWQVRQLTGTVAFKRPDAIRLAVTALEANGLPGRRLGTAQEIRLEPSTLYYLISQEEP